MNRVATKKKNIQQHQEAAVMLEDCRCTNFSFTEFAQKNKEVILFNGYAFKFQLNLVIKETEKHVSCTLTVELYRLKDTVPDEKICSITSIVVFKIENFDTVVKRNQAGKHELPQEINAVFGEVSVSTTRGMLCAKLTDTLYSNAIIPLFNVQQFLDNIKEAEKR